MPWGSTGTGSGTSACEARSEREARAEGGAGLILLLAVLAVVAGSTFAGIAVGGAGPAHTAGNVLTGVQLTGVHAVYPEVACRVRV